MLAFLTWYIVVQLLGLAALPVAAGWFARLPDRGYAVAKLLGILLTGFLLWLSNAYGWLPNDAAGALLCAAAVAAIGSWRFRRSQRPGAPEHPPLGEWLRSRVGLVITLELVFLVAFVVMALYRSWDPAIRHTEQPMDLAMLAGAQYSHDFPPQDPWLAGYPIGYYYMGYWLVGLLGNLSGQPPEVSYNLGLACWFGLLVVGSFGLGANLGSMAARSMPLRGRLLWGGLFASSVALTANLGGSLDSFRRLVAQVGDGGAWWWWRASRVLEDRDAQGGPIELIGEFPAFSYVLGDLHPHLLAMPLLLLTAYAALHLMMPGQAGATASDTVSGFSPTALPGGSWSWLLALLLAAPIAVSTWDFPAHFILLLAGILLANQGLQDEDATKSTWSTLVRTAACIGALTIIALTLLLPLLLTVQGMATGLAPNLFQATTMGRTLSHFGQFLPGIAILLVVAWRRHAPSRQSLVRTTILVAAVVGAATLLGASWALLTEGGRQWLSSSGWPTEAGPVAAEMLRRRLPGLPTMLLWGSVVVVSASLMWARRAGSVRSVAFSFALLMAGLGGLLALTPELVYVRDLFGTRLNTIFKLYYLAWPLLAMASAYGLLIGLEATDRGRSRALRTASLAGLVALAAGLLYPALAARTKADETSLPVTLDGLAHLAAESPDELATIRWVRENVPTTAIVVQAVGRSYRPGDSRVSAATGRATLLGWAGHEAQWRGAAFSEMSARRAAAVARLYRPSSTVELQEILDEWHIDFVYLGPTERAVYGVGVEVESLFEEGMRRVFRSGPVTLYWNRQVPEPSVPHIAPGSLPEIVP